MAGATTHRGNYPQGELPINKLFALITNILGVPLLTLQVGILRVLDDSLCSLIGTEDRGERDNGRGEGGPTGGT